MAAEAGLGVTVIGDPWQAVYGWRGATPDRVGTLLEAGFADYPLTQSFRFTGNQMPALAQSLRDGESVELPWISSDDVDVALARQWQHLLSAGRNILPLAFRTISNQTDAALNLFLDVVTRANLSRPSFGREGAIVQLGLDRDEVQNKQEQVFRPILESLVSGSAPESILDEVRGAMVSLGGRRPNRLSAAKEKVRLKELQMLGDCLKQGNLIPGMTVHQAKGREWTRVGVVLSEQDAQLLGRGLKPLTDEDCIIYVAITRAERQCGRLGEGMTFEVGAAD